MVARLCRLHRRGHWFEPSIGLCTPNPATPVGPHVGIYAVEHEDMPGVMQELTISVAPEPADVTTPEAALLMATDLLEAAEWLEGQPKNQTCLTTPPRRPSGWRGGPLGAERATS